MRPEDSAFVYLDEMITILEMGKSSSEECHTNVVLRKLREEIEGVEEYVAARCILRQFVGTTGSFNDFHFPDDPVKEERFNRLKSKLHRRGVELLGGVDLTLWRHDSDPMIETSNLGWKMGALIVGGALAGPAVWFSLPNSFGLGLWLLGVFSVGMVILRPYYIPARMLLSATAVIFASIGGLILIFSMAHRLNP